MRKDNKNKGRNNNRRKELKCDFCDNTSKDSKIYTKRNYPHGRKSKAVITHKCRACKYPEKSKETAEILAKVINSNNQDKKNKENKNGRK